MVKCVPKVTLFAIKHHLPFQLLDKSREHALQVCHRSFKFGESFLGLSLLLELWVPFSENSFALFHHGSASGDFGKFIFVVRLDGFHLFQYALTLGGNHQFVS